MAQVRVRKPTQKELEAMGVASWPIWTCEPSTFDWEYDEPEVCYLLAGKVTVRTPEGEVRFGQGDLVEFPAGLRCAWRVAEAVRKHYRLG
jgi:uncharacterized cupin superfamily protein